MILYVPKNLNLPVLLQQNNLLDPKIPINEYYYFISSIITQKACNKKYEDTEFVNLYRAKLSDVINNNHITKIKKDLNQLQVINENSFYRVGSFGLKGISKSFALHPNYRNNELQVITVDKTIENKKLLTGERKLNSSTYRKILLNKSLSKLYEDFNVLEFDISSAIDYLKLCLHAGCYVNYGVENISNKLFTQQDYNRLFVICNNLACKNFFFFVDDTSQRLHTNLTNLNKHLRRFLVVKNDNGVFTSLSEIDIKACQPLLVSTLYNIHITNPDRTEIDSQLLIEREKYLNTVENKDIYEEMSKEFNKLSNKPITRQQSKIKFIIEILFSKPKQNISIYQRVFKTQFPLLWQKILCFKNKKHNALAVYLQSLESKLMIRSIPKYLKHSVLTIHDSYLCLPYYIEITKTIIQLEFNKLGMNPSIITKIND